MYHIRESHVICNVDDGVDLHYEPELRDCFILDKQDKDYKIFRVRNIQLNVYYSRGSRGLGTSFLRNVHTTKEEVDLDNPIFETFLQESKVSSSKVKEMLKSLSKDAEKEAEVKATLIDLLSIVNKYMNELCQDEKELKKALLDKEVQHNLLEVLNIEIERCQNVYSR